METIGVTSIDPWFVLDNDRLINDLYYFDKLAYTIGKRELLENFCKSLPDGVNQFRGKMQEIEILEKAGLIFEYTPFEFSKDLLKTNDNQAIKYALRASKVLSSFSIKDKPHDDIFVDFLEIHRNFFQLNARVTSIILNNKSENNYTPIIKSNFHDFNESPHFSTSAVLSVILKKFPTLTGSIELEKLIDFKSDPDSKLKLARLKDWMLEVSKKNYTEKEIEQKVDFLLEEYRKQLDIHKLKYNLGYIETFVISSLEILENLAKLNFSKAAKAIFDFNKQDLNLLEAEQNMIGKEVAYIHNLNEQLSK